MLFLTSALFAVNCIYHSGALLILDPKVQRLVLPCVSVWFLRKLEFRTLIKVLTTTLERKNSTTIVTFYVLMF